MRVIVYVILKTFFVMLLVMCFSSCATIFSGFKSDIFIDGKVDESVTINSSAGEYKDVTLPTVVEVKRRKLDGQHIQISSEHHAFDDIVLEKTFNEWSLVSALMGVPLLCVDLMTNAVSKPKYDRFFIKPIDSLVADSLRWDGLMADNAPIDLAYRLRLKSQQLPAKYPRHEFNGTLGFGSNQADHLTHRFVDGFILPNRLETETECGDIFGDSYTVGKMEYHYRLNRKWDVGAMVAWGLSAESYTNYCYYDVEQSGNDNPGNYTTGGERCRSFSFAPSVRYTWFEQGSCRFYSRAALGLMRNHLHFHLEKWKNHGRESRSDPQHEERFDKTKWRMAYQLSPFGISVGAGPVRLFVELGYGCLGVCNVGLGFCF